MTEVLKRPAGTYREKTLVLCRYRYYRRDGFGGRFVEEAVMVKVEFSDQIKAAFGAAVGHLSSDPRNSGLELASYLTSNGKETF